MKERYVSKKLEDFLYKQFENYSENSGNHAWFSVSKYWIVIYLSIFKKYAINKQEALINYSVEQLLLEFTYFKEHDILSKEEINRFENSLKHLLHFDINEWKLNKDYQINRSTKEEFYYIVYTIMNFAKDNSYIFTLIRDYEKFDSYKLLFKNLK